MAMTVTPVTVAPDGLKSDVSGSLRFGMISLTFGAADTYVTGGFLVTAASFGFPTKIVTVEDATSQVGGYPFVYVPTVGTPGQGSMVCFSSAGTQLASNSAALQSDTVLLFAWGY